MEEYSNKFTIITNENDYQKRRIELVDTMLTCFCFDKNNVNTDEILEFLEGIKENFNKIEIILLEISSLDENFRNEIISQETIPYFQICEPHLDPYLLPLKNLDHFGLYI